MTFADFGLRPGLLRALAEKGYAAPTPIQSQAIPAVLAGRDVLAGAQTGTGKTAAFVLPALHTLETARGHVPRALVLTPTRELAAQVAQNACEYGKYAGLRTSVVFGGVNITPQIREMRAGCDLLVATPGRLLDLAEQNAVDLRQVSLFVLDEADRMLDMGFIHAIRRVIKLLPAARQNLMFSATYSQEIRDLASRILRNPVNIEVTPVNSTAERVEQQVYKLPKEHKRYLLAHLIDDGNWHQVLVFTRTKHGANRLAKQLESSGIRSAAIHGNKSQAARVRALADFKDNRIVALVATEVAARGLDIKELPHVVNYELPNVPEDYVHRIGRTARAGASGSAVSLVSPDEHGLLKDIERLLRRTLQVIPPPAYKVTATSEREPVANDRMQEQRRAVSPSQAGRQRQSGRNGQSGLAGRRGSPGTERRSGTQGPSESQGRSSAPRNAGFPHQSGTSRGHEPQRRLDAKREQPSHRQFDARREQASHGEFDARGQQTSHGQFDGRRQQPMQDRFGARRQQPTQDRFDARRQQTPQTQPDARRQQAPQHQPAGSHHPNAPRQQMTQRDRRQRGGERRRATHPHAR